MLRVHNLEYDSWRTVYYQRSTVIVTELLLIYALQRYALLCFALPYLIYPLITLYTLCPKLMRRPPPSLALLTPPTVYPNEPLMLLPYRSYSPPVYSSSITSTSNTMAPCMVFCSCRWYWHVKSPPSSPAVYSSPSSYA